MAEADVEDNECEKGDILATDTDCQQPVLAVQIHQVRIISLAKVAV